MKTEKFTHFRSVACSHLCPAETSGLYILKKRIAQLENIMGIARQCEMPKTVKELSLACKILSDEIATLEEAAQIILMQYEREVWPPIGGIEGIDEAVAELVEKLADEL
jgi:hypothetical protein